MLHGAKQLRVFLAHDRVQLGGLHPGFLHLLERPAGVHALMLAGVSNDQNAVLGLDLFKEGPHLPRAGKARLVEHVEMSAGRLGVLLAGKEALQGGRFNAGLAELACGLGSRREALDLVAALLGTLADRLKRGRLSGSGKSLESVYAVGGGKYLADCGLLLLV